MVKFRVFMENKIKDIVNIKTLIIESTPNVDSLDDVDKEEISYIVQYIDYLLLGDIPYNKETLETLMETIVITSIYQNNPRLLKVTSKLNEIIKKVEE